MKKEQELNNVSKSLVLFLLQNEELIEKSTVFEIYNYWSKKYTNKVEHDETVKWCLEFIEELKKKKIPNAQVIINCIQQYTK